MIQRYLYILAFFVSFSGFSQEPDKEDGNTLMRRDYSFGLNFNANAGATGWGLAFEYAVQKTYKYRNTYGFTFTNIRHPKEFKIYSSFSNSRGYYFGKLNSLVSFRPTYGGKLAIFKAKRENGIEISLKWSAGPSIGLLKPVYLRIERFGTAFDEKYNPSIHNIENITSRSSWGKGLGEATFEFGVFSRIGFDFNFSTTKNKISGGEVGVMVDYFIGKPVIIIHNNVGDNLFPSLYLQFNLGQKLY
ncbi:MAG: hypothetical protein GQ574_12015 [Crocinitomix sp.]|nr:hypothetical protein [Crocinitomix sp.]